jgi:hypothetical protein
MGITLTKNYFKSQVYPIHVYGSISLMIYYSENANFFLPLNGGEFTCYGEFKYEGSYKNSLRELKYFKASYNKEMELITAKSTDENISLTLKRDEEDHNVFSGKYDLAQPYDMGHIKYNLKDVKILNVNSESYLNYASMNK